MNMPVLMKIIEVFYFCQAGAFDMMNSAHAWHYEGQNGNNEVKNCSLY